MLIAVLTVSDRCSQGTQADTAGPATVAIIKSQWTDAEIESALLPDDEDAIAAWLAEVCEHGAALAITVGGTGMGPRDRTPEATRRVIDREAPGIAEAMRANGARSNQYAWLSRGIAGLCKTTLVVNLPGSKRGATESLESVLPLLKHAIEVAGGGQSHP
jgi:molybdenum cofactor synthesis domain-containing protein